MLLPALTLTPLEFIQRLGALIPPPKSHRDRHHGVLAPNAKLRGAVTALAPAASDYNAAAAEKKAQENTVEEVWRSPARYLRAMLLARFYQSTPLVCPICKADMRIIAFVTDGDSVHHCDWPRRMPSAANTTALSQDQASREGQRPSDTGSASPFPANP